MRKVIFLSIILLLIPATNTRAWIFTVMQGGAAYTVGYSCRFNDDDTAYLSKTLADSNQKTWTLSMWVKRGNLGISTEELFGTYDSPSNHDSRIFFNDDDTIHFYAYDASKGARYTSRVYRDVGSWYHFVFVYDSTVPTMKIYTNGVQETAFSTSTDPTLNDDGIWNGAYPHNIGRHPRLTTQLFDGYIAEVYFIDGQALTDDSFGQTSATTGQWVPIAYTGTYGTNGFHLDFANSASLGADVSGQGNNWTSSGLAATDQMKDTPTNSWATFNPIVIAGGTAVYSEGNLKLTGCNRPMSTIQIPNSGKWYAEWTAANGTEMPGVCTEAASTSSYIGSDDYGWSYHGGGNKYHSGTPTAYGASFNTGDIIGIAVDKDADSITFYTNNVSQGEAFTGLLDDLFFTVGQTANGRFNFGQDPVNVGGTCQTDANGYGCFKYAPPTGFLALCSANMPAPVTNLPANAFQTELYTGTGATRSISGFSFSPDLVVIKNRDQADEWMVIDSVRGATKEINWDSTNAESTDANGLTAFNSDGFSLGTGANGYNDNGEKFVSYSWLESATYGFDIVSYTGTGVAHAENHSLNAVPEAIIVKSLNESASKNHCVYHVKENATPQNYYMYLNETTVTNPDVEFWNNTAPTTSQFTVGVQTQVNENTKPFIAYLFAGKEGFSKFGSYTGNGNANGPFVYCGFKPAMIIIKDSGYTTNWILTDTARDPYNPAQWHLFPDLANGEAGTSIRYIDILSNGFKIRTSDSNVNYDTYKFVYLAFAERPFKYGNAR